MGPGGVTNRCDGRCSASTVVGKGLSAPAERYLIGSDGEGSHMFGWRRQRGASHASAATEQVAARTAASAPPTESTRLAIDSPGTRIDLNVALSSCTDRESVETCFGPYTTAELRERWKHEDELIHQRMSWLLGTQSVLFAAYGLALQAAQGASGRQDPGQLLGVLPLVGIAVAISTGLGVLAARAAMLQILCTANGAAPPETNRALLFAAIRPNDQKSRTTHAPTETAVQQLPATTWQPDVAAKTSFGGWLSSFLLHGVFIGAWILLLIDG